MIKRLYVLTACCLAVCGAAAPLASASGLSALPRALGPGAGLMQAGPPLTPGRDDVQFGRAVAVSADGNVAAIDGAQAGQTWVFARTGAVWALEAVLTAPDRSATTATSVAISADGGTVIVGSPDAPTGDGSTGAAWIFSRGATGWILRAKIASDVRGYAQLGKSVDLSADGRVAVVEEWNFRAISVYERQGDTWVAAGRIAPDRETPFGGVAVAPAGDIVYSAGQAYVRAGDAWLPSAGVVPSFGRPAVSADGRRMLVSTAFQTVQSFVRGDAGWALEATLAPLDPSPGATFGTSFDLSADGSVALVGGGQDRNTGNVWLFVHDGTTWAQSGSRLYSRELALGFGMEVALSADGSTALIGGAESRVWTFAEGASVTGVEPASGPRSGGTRVVLTGTGFTNARGVSFGDVKATSFRVLSPTRLAVRAPAGPAGSVHVTVDTPHAVSRISNADRFYRRTPVVSLGAGGLATRLARPGVRLRCQRTRCVGTLRLLRGRTLLARAPFALDEGKAATVRLRPTLAGKRARKRPPRVGQFVMTLEGAATVRRRIALR